MLLHPDTSAKSVRINEVTTSFESQMTVEKPAINAGRSTTASEITHRHRISVEAFDEVSCNAVQGVRLQIRERNGGRVRDRLIDTFC